MWAGQRPEQKKVYLGLPMRILRRPRWRFRLCAERQQKQEKKNGFAHEDIGNNDFLLFYHTPRSLMIAFRLADYCFLSLSYVR